MPYNTIFEREIENIMKTITVKEENGSGKKRNAFLNEHPIDPVNHEELFPEIAGAKRQKMELPKSDFYMLVDLDGTMLSGLSMKDAREILFGNGVMNDSFKEVLYNHAIEYGGKELGFTYYVLTMNEIFRKHKWSTRKEDELVNRSLYKVRWDFVHILEKIKEKHDCKVYITTGNAKSYSSKIVDRINSIAKETLFDGVLGSEIIFDEQGQMASFPKLVSNIKLTVSIGHNGDRRDVRLVRKLDMVREELDEKQFVVITDSVNDLCLINNGFTIYIHDKDEHDNSDQRLGADIKAYDLLVNPNDLTLIKDLFGI